MEKIQPVKILTGYECNNNCIFCLLSFNKSSRRQSAGAGPAPPWEKASNKTTEEIKERILQAKEAGASALEFTGGEPTIRKDFFRLLDFAGEQGFKPIIISTNGRMFSEKGFAEKTVGSGTKEFIFNIVSHRQETHDYLTQVQGSFRQTVKGVKNLGELGAKQRGNLLVCRQNYKSLPETVEFFAGLGFTGISIIYPHFRGNAKEHEKEIAVKMSRAAPHIIEALNRGRGRTEMAVCNIAPCFLKGYEKFVRMEPAASEATLFMKKIVKEKTRVPACGKCKYSAKCGGIDRNYLKLFGAREVKPVC